MTDSLRFSTALVVSALLHALVGLIAAFWLLIAAASIQPPQQMVEVDLAQLPPPAKPPAAPPPRAAAPAAEPPPPAIPIPRAQIVSPPDSGEEKPPSPDTRLFSDRDNRVAEEKVKRGEGQGRSDASKRARVADNIPEKPKAAKVGEGHQPAAPAREAKREPQQVAALPRLDQLLVSPGDLVREGIVAPPAAAKPTPAGQSRVDRDLLGGSGVAFSHRPGISDYLPQVREGDITLLNTKAERFAPFVRRVAARVFQHLSIRLRQAASRGVAGSGREFAVVEAVMSKQGRLVSARMVERQVQSSLGADRELLNVTRPETFFDSNPPDGAEGDDGNIHFILLIDLQVQGTVDPRSGRPFTGYYGVAGVGLDVLPKRN